MNIDREYIIILYEIYKNLLTDKERNYFEYYFYEDYSLNEIAEIFDVSKAYASKCLNQINNKLIKYEESLKINKKNNDIKSYLNTIKDNKIKEQIEDLL